jgi:hypothetical protein
MPTRASCVTDTAKLTVVLPPAGTAAGVRVPVVTVTKSGSPETRVTASWPAVTEPLFCSTTWIWWLLLGYHVPPG